MGDDDGVKPPKGLSGIAFSEFLVDFFGSLVPGILFVIGAIVGLIIPVADAFSRLGSTAESGLFGKLAAALVASSVGLAALLVVLLLLCFVAGTIFYRMDPKVVDLRSAQRLPKADLENGAVTEECRDLKKVEFPYRRLKAYLSHRGLAYLADRVPWDRYESNSRTKHFMNALKLRIAITKPDAYSLIARNEAHVRLSSSLWHACSVLMTVNVAGSGFLAFTNLVQLYRGVAVTSFAVGYSCSLLIALSCYATRAAIERTFHYQRLREVLHILELAYWCGVIQKGTDLFDGLVPPKAGPRHD